MDTVDIEDIHYFFETGGYGILRVKESTVHHSRIFAISKLTTRGSQGIYSNLHITPFISFTLHAAYPSQNNN